MAACTSSHRQSRNSRGAVATSCRNHCTAGRGAPAAAKNSADCALGFYHRRAAIQAEAAVIDALAATPFAL
jgi:hypothetical protein